MPAKSPINTAASTQRARAFGAAIRERRKHLGVSAIAAAESAGMSRVTWYRLEKGEPSVTMGAYFAAMDVLQLECHMSTVVQKSAKPSLDREEWIPARIALEDFPQLKKLSWHARGVSTLSPQEAFDIYERNRRHLDVQNLQEPERQLLVALRLAFGTPGHAIST